MKVFYESEIISTIKKVFEEVDQAGGRISHILLTTEEFDAFLKASNIQCKETSQSRFVYYRNVLLREDK